MDGRMPCGQVLLYDNDHYYMGGVLAELLVEHGCQVSLVTPAALVSAWTEYTLEQERIEKRLAHLGVSVIRQHSLEAIWEGGARLASTITGAAGEMECQAVVLATERKPQDELFQALKPALAQGRLDSLRLIGDAEAPNIIAQAVFAGHLAARQFDEEEADGTPFRIERVR
jgi:dimethylamine/trimethylamine dehydrogenase